MRDFLLRRMERLVHTKADSRCVVEQLVEWVGPFALDIFPVNDRGSRWYLGTRRGERIVVKRRPFLGLYLLSVAWGTVESELELRSEKAIRVVTGLKWQSVLSCFLGTAGAAVAAIVFLSGMAMLWVALAVLCANVGLFLFLGGKRVRKEFDALVRALEGVAVDARTE